jgi:hypothetical protein
MGKKRLRRKVVKYRGFEVTRKEIFSDLIFLIVGLVISLFAMFVFDVHWSFYPGESLFPPSRFVGIGRDVYLTGSLIGMVMVFLIIKLLMLGIKEDIE